MAKSSHFAGKSLRRQTWPKFLAALLLAISFLLLSRASAQMDDAAGSLDALPVGYRILRVLSPTMLEAFIVNTQGAGGNERPVPWDWVDEKTGQLNNAFPQPSDLTVTSNGKPVVLTRLGFRRLPIDAPLPSKIRGESRDLRIGNSLFIELADALPDDARVELSRVKEDPQWPATLRLGRTARQDRLSPVFHVSQVGYEPGWPKRVQVGYYCGTLGELPIAEAPFEVIRSSDGAVVFSGRLGRHPDVGFTASPLPYQQVLEAHFSPFTTPGEYQVQVQGLGRSHPFLIEEGVSGALARALALGIFHQRDGANQQVLPWTRFVDGPAHLQPAEILSDDPEFKKAWGFVAGMSKPSSTQTAPQLVDAATALYPPVKHGPVDVSGGHRDAGDYSKYTINTAGTVAILMFAVDSLAGVSELDNLGLPESGDGISDVLQEARFEADFLAKMQDDDGGFWFLVYPKNRPYEDNVLPSAGDRQVLFPKNTSATAAAVGALAQAGSSPAMRRAYPDVASTYRKKAELGWAFLERAIAAHGRVGSYQRVTHYGDEFLHDDELAFAAAGMFAMTGDTKFESFLKDLVPDPTSSSVRRWTWWPLFESYGHAFRAYAFAGRSGRVDPTRLNPEYLRKVTSAILAAGDAALKSSRESAYGTSYDNAFKRAGNAGYHFSASIAFDLAVAAELTSDPAQHSAFRDAAVANSGYTTGSNPMNLCFVSGLGWNRVRNVVSQFAQNAPRRFAPTGLPAGEIREGPYSFAPYRTPNGQNLLTQLIYPPGRFGTPIYDRVIDSFDVGNEATIIEQSRSAATALWLFAQTPNRNQKWRAPNASIITTPDSTSLVAKDLDLFDATIVWESEGQSPHFGGSKMPPVGTGWIEAEAQFPDGRRIFARTPAAP